SSELVHALLHRCEINQNRLDQFLGVGSGSGRNSRGNLGGGRTYRFRRQPAKLRVGACDHLSGRIAIRLPGQGGSDTHANYDQRPGNSPPERWLPAPTAKTAGSIFSSLNGSVSSLELVMLGFLLRLARPSRCDPHSPPENANPRQLVA